MPLVVVACGGGSGGVVVVTGLRTRYTGSMGR
jgi:hypothetical protein